MVPLLSFADLRPGAQAQEQQQERMKIACFSAQSYDVDTLKPFAEKKGLLKDHEFV